MLSIDIINLITKYCNFHYCTDCNDDKTPCNEMIENDNYLQCSYHRHRRITKYHQKMINYVNAPPEMLRLRSTDIILYKKLLFNELYRNMDVEDHFLHFEKCLHYM